MFIRRWLGFDPSPSIICPSHSPINALSAAPCARAGPDGIATQWLRKMETPRERMEFMVAGCLGFRLPARETGKSKAPRDELSSGNPGCGGPAVCAGDSMPVRFVDKAVASGGCPENSPALQRWESRLSLETKSRRD